jgi:predicted MFS family arabinose efflux permease
MVLLAAVSSLTVLQAPLDLLTRRLSRPVTLVALVGIVAVLLLDGTISRRFDDALLAGAATTGVTCVYVLVHRAMPSALGWGDVASLEYVVMWQLAASAGAAVHGVMSRLVGAGSTIAFGPHLLLWAWLVVVLTL